MQAQNHAKTKLWKNDLQKDILEFPKLTSLKRQMKRWFCSTWHIIILYCPSLHQGCVAYWYVFPPVFETKVDMSIYFGTGRRGTDCPDRGTFLAYQDISTGNSYWNPSIGCQDLGLKVWINVMSPKPLSPQDGDMVTWWAAEAIALAKRQAGPCWVTFWKVTHCTMTPHFLDMTGWWFGTFGWFFH